MHILNHASRRAFLRQAGTLTALVGGGATPLALNLAAMSSAAAQSAGPYKAIVCLFMYGGNDAFNMVLPTDADSWSAYSTTRNQGTDPIALLPAGVMPNPDAPANSPARLGGVLPINPLNAQGRSYALHPLLGSLKTLFDTDKRLAILPNIGPLILPTTKAQYGQGSHPKPAQLFSHNDQQNTWQALGPEGTPLGWAGLMGDLVSAQNERSVFTAVSASGNSVWLAGNLVKQYQVGTLGPFRLGLDSNDRVYGSTDVGAALQRLVTSSRTTNPFDADVADVARRAIDAEVVLRTALLPPSNAAFGTPVVGTATYSQNTDPKLRYISPATGLEATNTLAHQMQIVARMIDGGMRGQTGARRQVFFVSLGNFDTHDAQNRDQSDTMARIAHAMSYFDNALGNIGARSSVTTFTGSDFGRTFLTNGDGTDHGWGAHHFVMGGAVTGGDLYGRFPTLSVKNANNNNFDGSPDQIGNGSLLPQTSVEQLGATLGRWFGLSDGQLAGIFPNLANWNVNVRNLGFLAPP